MTEIKIKSYYKLLSIITLLLSITSLFISNEQEFSNRIIPAVMINVAFHIVYHFLSRMPIGIYEHVIQNKSTKSELTLKAERFVLKFFRVFSIALMVISIIGIIFFLKTVFTEGRYESLFMITIFGAVFLGGYKSKLKLSEKLVPTET